MRHVLIGAVDSTLIALESMLEAGYPPDAVFTVVPEISHRNSTYIDLGPICAKKGLPLFRFRSVNASAVLERLSEMRPDIIWVIGLSQLVRTPLLQLPTVGVIGFHPSALPENRGRAVIPWTIIQGKKETGSSLFWIDEGMDTGPILSQRLIPISKNETARILQDKHLAALKDMMLDLLPRLAGGERPSQPQEHSKATWCARRTPEDGLIDWSKPAHDIWTLVRATGRPYPGAFTYFGKEPLTIWSADLIEVHPGLYWGFPGQIMDFRNGHPAVLCGDGHLLLLEDIASRETGERFQGRNFRMHQCFGR